MSIMMTSLLTSTSTTVIASLIEIFLPTVMAIITGRNKEKNDVEIDLVIECFEETQKRFAENYNEIYTIDDVDLFSQMLKIYASNGIKGQKVEQIIAGIIESSFKVDATNTMIEVWKTCFDKTISDKKYANLLLLVGSSNDNFKKEDYFYKNANIFLSYSWKDEKKADEIDAFFSGIGIDIRRDKKSIEQWGSIRAFMNSIKYSDYAILIISDAYLKSVNCMYEIAQLMKDEQYKDRIFPVVLDKEIYQLNRRIDYIVYWEKKYDEVRENVTRVKNPENIGRLSIELHQIREISYSVGEFLDIIRDMNNPKTQGIAQAIYERLCDKKLIGNMRFF